MTPDIRLIAIDLDGTLLDGDKQIPPENVEALHAAAKTGIHIALCTGRMLPNIESTVDLLRLDPVLAGYNGAKVVDTRESGRAVLHHRPVPARRAQPILMHAAQRGWLLHFYHEDRLFAQPNEGMRELMDLYLSRGGAPYEFVHPETLTGLSPTKLIFIAATRELPHIERQVGPDLDGLSCVRTEAEYLEIMAPGVNKASALRALAAHFDVGVEQCLAIGDSGNDIEMLEAAGLGVAVGNAREDVKAVADVVVELSNEDGAVAHIIEEWVLRRR